MTRKRFNADVETAKQSVGNINVSNIKRGESDGEAVFDYSHPRQQGPLRIQILSSSLDDYPAHSSFLVFTDCDVTPQISTVLESAAGWTSAKDVCASIVAISKHLNAALSPELGENGDTGFSDSEDLELGGRHDDASDGYLYEDDFLGEDSSLDSFGSGKRDAGAEETGLPASSHYCWQRLREDIFEAKRAGFHIGVLRGGADYLGNTFSLSLRVSRLGIPEETLDAWDVGSRDYLVLLFKFSGAYQGFEALATANPEQTYLFGKCSKPKPSMASVTLALSGTLAGTGVSSADHNHDDNVSSDGSFKALYISPSINSILKDDLVSLIHIRLQDGGGSWDSARETLHQRMHGAHLNHQHIPNAAAFPQAHLKSVAGNDALISPTAQKALNKDHVLGRDTNDGALSTPLAAMQLALRQFARCTEYCMICHKRIEDDFEAVKPFVCPNPLCLYQYMALGLGPSTEHEIISQPQTVDLLISFFFTAVAENRIREWPKGLAIKVPAVLVRETLSANALFASPATGTALAFPPLLNFGAAPASAVTDPSAGDGFTEVMEAIVDLRWNEFVVTGFPQRHHRFHTNDWVLLVRDVHPNRHYEYVCRVTSCSDGRIFFELVSTHQSNGPNSIETVTSWPTNRKIISVAEDEQVFKATVHPFDRDLEDPSMGCRLTRSFIRLLHMIPPVQRMRTYLLAHPGSSLSSWGAMPPAAVTLLRWIIKSNRSSIVQIESAGKEARHSHKVRGVEGYYMQFRFAQGTIDKEFRFQRALESRTKESAKDEVPTIFAWHGSPFGNWHSIIRTGLDFNQVHHGRAFGNGVYMSPQITTSQTYGHHQLGATGLGWPSSELGFGGALCLCEVLNYPEKFVSTYPHIVVDKIDWIQVRYLFVLSSKAVEISRLGPPETATVPYIVQDSRFALEGSPNLFTTTDPATSGRAQVPLSVIPRGRRRLYRTINIGSGAAPSVQEIIVIDDDSEADDSELIRPPKAEIQAKSSLGKHKRSSGPELIGAVDLTAESPPKRPSRGRGRNSDHGRSMTREILDTTKTCFRPGTLDMMRLPRLPEPSWALPAASKSASRELKALQKVQAETPLHDLGWYINFDHITNLFHWIVELHTFDPALPLARDMKTLECASIVCEVRFPPGFPVSPPFVRVIRPRFLPFSLGGGGHVTGGGAMCMELLTSTGWSPAFSMESVLLQVRLALCNLEPRPARLIQNNMAVVGGDYGIAEAVAAYIRVSNAHGWNVPADFAKTAALVWS